MNKKFFLVGLSLSIFLVSFFSPKKERKHFEKEESSPRGDWFYDQRTFPYSEINYAEYGKAIERSASMKAVAKHTNAAWEFAGPINIGGRITDVEMPSSNTSIIYAGSASGGIFKSTDFGNSWNAIFDDAKSLSIGDITLAPSNENVLYVGTGEPNGGSGSLTYGGFGVYKSTNAGESWTHCGLDSTRFIGKIAVHPTNYNIAYVAAMGTMYSKNEQRGVYRTFDGGLSWQKVFFLSDSTGCIDIAINPNAPNIIYAAMFERMRYAWQRSYGGITSGLYRSTDAGNTWTQLTNGLPPNSPNISRITIALFHPNPEIIYVSYAASSGELMGVYKTTNGGETWTPINSAELSGIFTSYGYWFGGIKVHSSDSNILYMLGLYSMKSTNGGANWFSNDFNVHVDHHALFVHPQNPSLVLEGNDGGLYYSNDGGNNFTHFENLPNNQFYTCEVDEQNPTNLYGGTQDNGTNRTLTGNLNDWQELFGGDGFYVLVDPNDNSFLYMEYQYGGFSFGTNGINFSDRFNWSTPFVFNPLNSASLFLGSDKMYKTTDRANNWTAISPDLTNGPSPGNLPYGTITTIAVAPSDSNTIYAGTDDANVWVTSNSGVNWTNIS
ncbi:MAG: hypothetical protein FJ218_11280, partial [Ignavibacteria bacterium]|nr:hypothetical protein [Ignavibacteria bacterium]